MASESTEVLNDQPLHKYDTAEMRDPLVRCHACAKLVATEFIKKHAACNHCGNKRFFFLYVLQMDELNAIREGTYDLGIDEYEIDPEYLDIFEVVAS